MAVFRPTRASAPSTVTEAPLRVPRLVQLVALIGVVVIIGPVLALTARVDWPRFFPILAETETRSLLQVTLYAAVQSSLIAVVLGVPLAVLVSSSQRVGAQFVRLLIILPLAMPPVVAGLALTAAMGRRGITAPILDALGIQFAFAFPGVVLAHVFVTLPFVVVSVDSALRTIDREVLDSAAGVGMRPAAILWRITLPAIAPAVAAGAGLAFARSLGEFGTTLTFAGSMPGVTRTMPIGIYLERELDQDRAYVLAAVLVFLAIVVLCAAALPSLLRRTPAPRPHRIVPLDAERMHALTRPTSGSDSCGAGAEQAEVAITTRGTTTRFRPGVMTALIGPNGSGKTTLAGLIAGRLRGAEVSCGDTVFDSPGGGLVPAHQRGVVLLTQRPGLPRTAKVDQALTMVTRDAAVTAELLEASGLADLADTPVPALSGGQAAQVALVRALASRPRVLILDEPLAAIDVDSATQWRRLLKVGSAERTTILVTHDPVDLAGLADRVAVMAGGRCVAELDVEEFLRLPPTEFSARLAGVNRLEGTVRTFLDDVHGRVVGVAAAGQVVYGVPAADRGEPGAACGDDAATTADSCPAEAPAVVTFAPTAVRLIARDEAAYGAEDRATAAHAEAPGQLRNRWRGRISHIDSRLADAGGSLTLTITMGDTAQFSALAGTADVAEAGLRVGQEVTCLVDPADVTVHPAASGDRYPR